MALLLIVSNIRHILQTGHNQCFFKNDVAATNTYRCAYNTNTTDVNIYNAIQFNSIQLSLYLTILRLTFKLYTPYICV